MSLINGDDFGKEKSFVSKKYALVVGVDISSRTPSLTPLRYAESDARGISALLQREESNFAFPSPVLVGEAAKTQDVRQAVIHLIEQKSQNDLLLFYFIGHAYPIQTDSQEIDVYLVTADFDPDIAQLDSSAYISLHWIQQTILEKNKVSNIVIVLDCVYIGDIFQNSKNSSLFQFRQLIKRYVDDFPQKEQVRRPSNRSWAILATAPQSSAATEQNESHTGITSLMLEALGGRDRRALDRNGKVSLLSLYNYLTERLELAGSPRLALQDGLVHSLLLAEHPAQKPVSDERGSRLRSEKVEETIPDPGLRFFDMTICEEATFADLDSEQINIFLQSERVRLQSDYHTGLSVEKQFEELGLSRGGHPTYGALLCFGRRPTHQIAGAYMRCIEWKGKDRQSGWREEKEYRGSLLQQFAAGCRFLWENLQFARNITPGGSSEQPEIPFQVLEEVIANALIHREYVTEIDGRLRSRPEGVQVEIFSDRVEISSLGKPPLPITVEALANASRQRVGSHARNPQIVRIFYLAGYVGKAGSGVERIRLLMTDAGSLPPRFSLKEQDQVLVIELSRRGQTPPHSVSNKAGALVREAREKESSLQPDNSVERQLVEASPKVGRSPNVSKRSSWLDWPGKLLVVLVCILLISGGTLVYKEFFPPPSTTIEIASDFATSGNEAITGLPLQDAVQMAINEANNEKLLPDYTLKLLPYDDTGSNNLHNPRKGAQNVERAIADNLVAGIIGPGNSSVAEAEMPLTNQASMAQISPTTSNPCLTKNVRVDPNCSGTYNIEPQMRPTGRLTYFRLVATDDIQGKEAADFLFTTKRYQRAILIEDNTDLYSRGLAQSFQAESQGLGGRVIVQYLPEATSSEQKYQSALQSLISSQPDLVYFAGNSPNGSYALQALTSIPELRTVAFAGGDGIVNNTLPNSALTLHVSAPVYGSLPIVDPAHSGTTLGLGFQSQFRAYCSREYPKDATSCYKNYDSYAASSYDSTMMLILAIRTALQQGVLTPHGAQDQAGAKKFRQAVLQALEQNHYTDKTGVTRSSYMGATGPQSFDSNGDTNNHTISFYQLDLTTTQPDWKWLQQISG